MKQTLYNICPAIEKSEIHFYCHINLFDVVWVGRYDRRIKKKYLFKRTLETVSFLFQNHPFFLTIDTCIQNNRLHAWWLSKKKRDCQRKLTASCGIVYPNNSSRKLQKFAPTIFMTIFFSMFLSFSHRACYPILYESDTNNFILQSFVFGEEKRTKIKSNWKQLFSWKVAVNFQYAHQFERNKKNLVDICCLFLLTCFWRVNFSLFNKRLIFRANKASTFFL